MSGWVAYKNLSEVIAFINIKRRQQDLVAKGGIGDAF